MDKYDLARIENAVWVLMRYSDELDDTNADIVVDGVWVSTNDALRVLSIALDKLKEVNDNEQ